MKPKVSVVIPSRSDQYLQKTVDDLLAKAKGDIEVIVVYDGRWSDPILRDDPRLLQIHHGEIHDNIGMRGSINVGMLVASGDYVMKIDEQCMVSLGYDAQLIADCQEDTVLIPRRKRLEPETWTIIEDGRPPIDYMCVDYPYQRPYDKTCGLHGAEWKRPDRTHLQLDETPTMQGSCYFMKKSYWEQLFPNGLDDVNYGTFTQEAQEISMKVWLSGGEVLVDKLAWYAHWHKGKHGKGYGFSNEQYKKHLAGTERGRLYAIQYWLTTQEFEHDFSWFIGKFSDMPGWENWKERIEQDKDKDFSSTYGEEYKPSWS